MKITLTYDFDNLADFQAYMDGIGTERAADIAATRAVDVPVTAELPVADVTVDVREPEITASVDSDGLPYDPEIHAMPKSFTAEGQWRSKRGKAGEANAARAAFKASGGAVAPPAPVVTPVVTAAPAARGMPMPAAAPAPVTYDALFNKTTGMMDRGVIDYDGVVALYASIGLTDPSVLETNESMRAALFTALTKIEA